MPAFAEGAARTGHWLHIVARGDRLLHREFDEKLKKDVDLFEVCDDVCIRKMLDSFAEQKAQPGFAGLLLDFDHSSLDNDKPTEAAGWLMDAREVPDGIEYLVDFSDIGWAAVQGKRYKFCSKVFANPPAGAEIIDTNTFRPTVLDRAALTNDPRSKSLRAFGQAFIDRAAHGPVEFGARSQS